MEFWVKAAAELPKIGAEVVIGAGEVDCVEFWVKAAAELAKVGAEVVIGTGGKGCVVPERLIARVI